MDEAFLPFRDILKQMLSFSGDVFDEEAGIYYFISECEIDSPVELEVVMDEHGALQIGSTPPLYYVDTTFSPSFHRLRFIAQRSEGTDGS